MSKPSYEELRRRRNQAFLKKHHPEYADDSPTMVKLRQRQAMRDLELKGERDTPLYKKLWAESGMDKQTPGLTPAQKRKMERLDR